MKNQISIESTEFVLIGKSSLKGKRLSFHTVENEMIGAEIPFLESVAKNIFSLFNTADDNYHVKTFEGLIPTSILFARDCQEKGTHLIWHVKKQLRKLSFSEKCKITSETYSIPHLVFSFKNGNLAVYAVDDVDSISINENTPLYNAPFYNTYADGKICMGNVDLKKANSFLSFEKTVTYLENVFFNSVFTHSNNELITRDYLIKNYNTGTWNKKNLFKSSSLILKNLL